jgi:tripartite-type tricarboxylate transporter receptor subunit TctC
LKFYARCITALSALAFAAASEPGLAQSGVSFAGRPITLYIGFAPGGSYDFYARLVARHMGKHLPGNPTIIPQNMPGAGSFLAANYLFTVAPKDGTALAVLTQTIALEEALKTPGVQYRSAEFNWIGRMTSILEVTLTAPKSKVRTIEDAMRVETPLAGTGPGSPSEGYPKLLNALAGTKFKVISGYPGSTQAMMAAEGGEVDGALTSWNTLRRTKPSWLDNREIGLLVQYALKRHPDMPDVPAIVELGKTDEAKQILTFYVSGAEVGRALAAPPGMPPERVRLLRAAFDAMLKDPEFMAEVEKTKVEFYPASGEELQQLIRETANAPPQLIEKMQSLLR